jgi:hypothetical protein
MVQVFYNTFPIPCKMYSTRSVVSVVNSFVFPLSWDNQAFLQYTAVNHSKVFSSVCSDCPHLFIHSESNIQDVRATFECKLIIQSHKKSRLNAKGLFASKLEELDCRTTP